MSNYMKYKNSEALYEDLKEKVRDIEYRQKVIIIRYNGEVLEIAPDENGYKAFICGKPVGDIDVADVYTYALDFAAENVVADYITVDCKRLTALNDEVLQYVDSFNRTHSVNLKSCAENCRVGGKTLGVYDDQKLEIMLYTPNVKTKIVFDGFRMFCGKNALLCGNAKQMYKKFFALIEAKGYVFDEIFR